MIWIILGVMAYIGITGMWWKLFYKQAIAKCQQCRHGEPYSVDVYDGYGYKRNSKMVEPGYGHVGPMFFKALVWPLTGVFYLGSLVPDSTSRIERKRAQEIAAAEHRARLREIEARELKALESQLED